MSKIASERKQLDEGAAELVWPDEMSVESFSEFEYWLTGVLNRARRRMRSKLPRLDDADDYGPLSMEWDDPIEHAPEEHIKSPADAETSKESL